MKLEISVRDSSQLWADDILDCTVNINEYDGKVCEKVRTGNKANEPALSLLMKSSRVKSEPRKVGLHRAGGGRILIY